MRDGVGASGRFRLEEHGQTTFFVFPISPLSDAPFLHHCRDVILMSNGD